MFEIIKSKMKEGLRNFLFTDEGSKGVSSGVFSLQELVDMDRHGQVKAGNYESMVKANVGIVYRCINILAFDVASVPFYVKKREGKEKKIIEDHPFYKLYENPNPYMLGWELKWFQQGFLDGTGNSYLYVPRTLLNRPYQLYILPTQNVNKRIDNGRFLYDYFNGRESMTFTEEEIVHFKYPNIANINIGMGPIEAARMEVNKDLYMNMFHLSLFANRARPDGVLATEMELNPEQIKELRTQWNKAHRGMGKVAKIAVLTKGLKYDPITIAPKDLEYVTGQGMNAERILGIFGVPKDRFNMTDTVNLANADAMERAYYKSTIAPRVKLRDAHMTKIVKLYDPRLFVESENMIPEDKEFKLKEEKQDLENAVITINEVRNRRGLDPVPWGDVPFMPFNMMPIGSGITKKDEGKIYTLPKDLKPSEALTYNKQWEAFKKQWKEQYWKGYVRRTEGEERLYISKLRDYFNEQEKRVLANIRKYGKAYKKVSLFLFSLFEWDEKITDLMEPLAKASIKNGAETLIEDFSLGISFDITSPFIPEFFKGREMLITNINRETFEQLKNTLEEGLANGETIKELSNRVGNVYDVARGSRSKLIARTEVNTANNFGHMEAMRQAEIEKKEWVTAGDEKVRDEHVQNEADGCIGRNDTFSGTGESYPGEPNCRCVVTPCLDELKGRFL
jgi:HK97 family phage portal protein